MTDNEQISETAGKPQTLRVLCQSARNSRRRRWRHDPTTQGQVSARARRGTARRSRPHRGVSRAILMTRPTICSPSYARFLAVGRRRQFLSEGMAVSAMLQLSSHIKFRVGLGLFHWDHYMFIWTAGKHYIRLSGIRVGSSGIT